MNNKTLLTMFFALMILCSVSAVQASDVNLTDGSNNLSSTSDNNNLQCFDDSDDDSDLLSEDDSEEDSGLESCYDSDNDTELELSDEDLELESTNDSESVDSTYLSTNNESILSAGIVKNQTELISPTASTYYKGSYSVVLMDSTSNMSLANQVVYFVINNVVYSAVTDSNGVASINLALAPGTYKVTSYYNGNGSYEASENLSSTLKILSTIKSSSFTKYYKGSAKYTATFYKSDGNVLANTNVKITVNGKTYTKKTNSKGVVTLKINLKPGTYKIVSVDPVTGYKITTKVKVLSTIKGSNLYKVYLDGKKFKVKFYKKNGKVLANKYVKLKINGKTYKVKTNSYGNARLSLKYLKKGTYTIKCYNTDGLTKKYKVKVYKKVSTKLTTSFYTFYKKETKKIKVKLTNSLGYAPTSGKIIKITINGKTYTKKTNSNGNVYLKLPSLSKGVYTIKCKFSGTSNYKASSTSNKVTVLTSKYTKLNVKSTKTFGYGAGTSFKVAVTAGGVPLVKKTVTFTVNGKSYTKTTNSNGIASLPIKLAIGNYTIKYSVKKDSKTIAKSGSCDIEVKNRTGTTLTWKSGTSFTTSQTFKVLLKDSNGKAISGQTVKLTINSKTYSATTSSSGYAKFKTSAPIGSYTVKVKFAGSNTYLASSTSKTVSVTYSNLKKGINEKNTISDLTKYLKSSTNCQVNNAKIKKLVTKLTSGLTSELDKAKAIFNYVRDYLSYSFYYNTKYGAVKTLTAMKGNCVDHSHLLVAMFRTAGLAARYVHGTCKFSSGNTYGHVWTQVLIGDTWVCADATSSKNSLGTIKNWNTNSFTLKGIYSSLSF